MHPPPECNNPYGRHLRAHPLLEVLSPPSAGTRVSDCRERCCLRAVRPPEWPDPPRSAEVGMECHLPGGGGVATPSKRDGHVHMWVGGTAWRRSQSERAGGPQMASRTMDEKPLRAWPYLCSPRCPHGARSNRRRAGDANSGILELPSKCELDSLLGGQLPLLPTEMWDRSY